MATELIPKDWKQAVCAILRTQDGAKIKITNRARNEFFAQFPNAFDYNLYELFIHYLSQDDAIARLVPNLKPLGTAYEFICTYEGEKVYAKINLLAEGGIVMIISAHRPFKGDTL